MNYSFPISSGSSGIYGQSIGSYASFPPSSSFGIPLSTNTMGQNITGISNAAFPSVYLN